MSTFTTACSTFDTACTTWLTALGVFQVAAQVVQTADVSQYKSYGSPRIGQHGGTGTAIMQKLAAYAAFQQFMAECDLQENIAKFSQGGTAGNANPLTVLATVFSAD